MSDLANEYLEKLKPHQNSLPELASTYTAMRDDSALRENNALHLLALDKAYFQLTKEMEPPKQPEREPSLSSLTRAVVNGFERRHYGSNVMKIVPVTKPSFWRALKKYPKAAFREFIFSSMAMGIFAVLIIIGLMSEVSGTTDIGFRRFFIALGIFFSVMFFFIVPLSLMKTAFEKQLAVWYAWYEEKQEYEKLKNAFDEINRLREAALNAIVA